MGLYSGPLDTGLEVYVRLKAFNSVSTTQCKHVLQKLEEIGVNQFILKWSKSCLTEFQQFLVADGSSSLNVHYIVHMTMLWCE